MESENVKWIDEYLSSQGYNLADNNRWQKELKGLKNGQPTNILVEYEVFEECEVGIGVEKRYNNELMVSAYVESVEDFNTFLA